MSQSRTNRGRARLCAFHPALDGRLEDRVLLSTAASRIKDQLALSGDLLRHPAARNGYLLKHPPQLAPVRPISMAKCGSGPAWRRPRPPEAVKTSRSTRGGTHYMVSLSYTSNTLATNVAEGTNGQGGATSATTSSALVSQASTTYPQPIGVVRAYAMSGGKVGIIVDGSTQNTELTINPAGATATQGLRSQFRLWSGRSGPYLEHRPDHDQQRPDRRRRRFSGRRPLRPARRSAERPPIDRIAFDAIEPGASITTGGDVNTLDVLNGITLSGTSINIGRDLNLFNVGGNIDLTNGARFNIGRNLGLVSQPPKGTGTGTNILTLNYTSVANSIVTVTIPAVGTYIQGNVTTDATSSFNIGTNSTGDIFNTMYVAGTVTAGFAPIAAPNTVGALARLTINGKPATLLQTRLSEFMLSADSNDEGYVTAIGGFA